MTKKAILKNYSLLLNILGAWLFINAITDFDFDLPEIALICLTSPLRKNQTHCSFPSKTPFYFPVKHYQS
jgi:hypothetical protein